MINTGIEAFDKTVETTNIWLKELMLEMDTGDKHRAYQALRATLHALRDRLTMGEVLDLGAQLPMLIRGLYYEGWKPGDKPLKVKRKEEFFELFREKVGNVPVLDPELAVRATFTVLSRKVTEGEIRDIKSILPEALRDLWPSR